MSKDGIKLLVLAGAVAFAVLYGMELASSGIASVYGPMETSAADTKSTSTNDDAWTLPPRKTDTAPSSRHGNSRTDSAADDGAYVYEWEADWEAVPRQTRKPIVDRISGKTAEALHDLSSGGIRFVVTLFDRITGS